MEKLNIVEYIVFLGLWPAAIYLVLVTACTIATKGEALKMIFVVAKQREYGWVIAFVLSVICLTYFSALQLYILPNRHADYHHTTYTHFVEPTISAFKDCGAASETNTVRIYPRMVIWDLDANGLHRIHSNSIFVGMDTAERNDKKVTVVLVKHKTYKLDGHYTVSGSPGFRQVLQVCLVDWESRMPMKFLTIEGDNLPARKIQHDPGYGVAHSSLIRALRNEMVKKRP